MTFTRFNTEYNFDFLSVYNGPNAFYSQLLRTSGSALPSAVTGSQQTMTVTFTSDGSFVYSGVNIIVTFVPISIPCSGPTVITTSGTVINTNPGFQTYANGQSCTWYIVAPTGYIPRVTFSSFNTELSYDFVRVYNSYGTSGAQLLQASGSIIPSAVTANQQYMTVTFTSDYAIAYSGVVATVSFISVNSCSSSAITSSGSVLDTNPGSATYGNSQSCTWYITAPEGYVPRLTFTRFSTELNYDFFTVYNGPSSIYSQLLRTSGAYLPSAVTGSQRYLTVTFSSDTTAVFSGVAAIVTFVPVGQCSAPSSISTSGTWINTNNGVSAYSNGQSCTWTITAPYGFRPQLVFYSFNTELNYDFFTVYDAAYASPSATLLRHSGSVVPSSVTASQQSMTVTFTSDGSAVFSGVLASVVFV